MSFDVRRIGDRDFQVDFGKDKIVQFHIKRNQTDPETSYFLVEKAAKHLLDSSSTKHFRVQHGSRKWKVVKSSPDNWFVKLKAFLLPIHHSKNRNIPCYDIEKTFFCRKKDKLGKDVQNFNHLMKDFQAEKLPFNLFSLEDYRKGLRGEMALQKQTPPYQDPFTSLAAWSFQHNEPEFISRDSRKPEHSSFRLIKINDKIQLVHQSSPLATEENKRAAAKAFFEQCEELFGKERVDYINYHYLLDLENASELTPEHVYRFNIGTTNREFQTVEEFSKKIQENQLGQLPKYTLLKMGEDLSVILNKYPLLLKPCSEWDQNTFNGVQKWLFPSDMELDLAYTGRKITQMIQSAYTTAELGEFKPWVDQQEMTQIAKELVEASSWASYMEILSHVAAKKHLARMHPEEGYRVGALIPAPPEKKGGPVRWYKVTGFSSNRHIHGYTLEGAYPGSKLPAIKLYRSTASSPAALNSSGSLETDFSHINSPGYTGIKMLDDYDREFFDKRSIPLWVGYQTIAEQKIEKGFSDNQCLEVFKNLGLANEKLVEDEHRRNSKKTLREVIRENDAILNELFLRYSGFKKTREDNVSSQLLKKYGKSYLKIYSRLVCDYVHPELEEVILISDQKTKKDAVRLYHLLGKMKHKLPDPPTRDKILIHDLMSDIEKHIFSSGQVFNEAAARKFQDNVLEDLLILEDEVNSAIALKNFDIARLLMERWSQSLKAYAMVRNEHLESKIDEDIHVAGQSLGGACAAESLSHHLIKRGRIPLPGRHASLFEYDAPGLNKEDNDRFIALGNENTDLLKSLRSQFDIIRRQETGDPLAFLGHVHLGAVYSEEDALRVGQWLRFDATINERLKTSKSPAIAESYAPHATRFLEGRRLRTFFRKDDKSADYVETHYSPQIQGIVDLRGHIGDNKKEIKANKKTYRFVFKKRWKLSRRFEYFFREELRNSLDLLGWFVRKLLFGSRELDMHELPESLLDRRGCFKVSLNRGVETRS